jgi:hypothetical protein
VTGDGHQTALGATAGFVQRYLFPRGKHGKINA